ncbi:hypothetical protein, partial [Microbacterium gubbeenense]|uniref:hypothetical protein n=1 Tax=Microbacterium gubbeenense TaxID=159896 RepID=UPI003F9818B0
MIPTQQHAVIGVGLAAVSVLVHVVDLAPPSRNRTAGDDASAVAGGDGSALVSVEQALAVADLNDATVAVENHFLNRTRADDAVGKACRCGDVHAVDIDDAAVEIADRRRDDECRGRAAERG